MICNLPLMNTKRPNTTHTYSHANLVSVSLKNKVSCFSLNMIIVLWYNPCPQLLLQPNITCMNNYLLCSIRGTTLDGLWENLIYPNLVQFPILIFVPVIPELIFLRLHPRGLLRISFSLRLWPQIIYKSTKRAILISDGLCCYKYP